MRIQSVNTSDDQSPIQFRIVHYDQSVLDKLWDKHDLEQWEVDQALQGEGVRAGWQTHPRHGHRVVAQVHIEGQGELFAALTPIDIESGIWTCKTAYILEEGQTGQ